MPNNPSDYAPLEAQPTYCQINAGLVRLGTSYASAGKTLPSGKEYRRDEKICFAYTKAPDVGVL